MMTNRWALWALLVSLAWLGGCATPAPAHDYTAFLNAKPTTVLVLPPTNDSPEIKATPGVWAHATRPLAEAGYYVLPVTLVDETFRENGIHSASDAHGLPAERLREVFGADAALYISVKQYGTSYRLVSSETRVEVVGRLVDLRSGGLLWQGRAVASSAEQQQQAQGGLVGLLVTAVVNQVISSTTDQAFNYAGIAGDRLLGAPRYNGVLPGPRSPRKWQVAAPRQ